MLENTAHPPTNKRALLLLGMQRSAVSALSGLCSASGVELGADNNEAASFEHSDIRALHDRLLAVCGSSWDDTRFLPDKWWERAEVEPFYDELKSLIKRDFIHSSLWGANDPCLAKLLPLWYKVLADSGVEPLIVVMLCHPAEAVMSLAESHQFPAVKSLLLWLEHLVEVEKYTRNSKRVFIAHEALVDAPAQILAHVAEQLHISLPLAADRLELTHPVLRHHQEAVLPDTLHPVMDGWVKSALEAITALKRNPVNTPEQCASLQLSLCEMLAEGQEFFSFWCDEAIAQRSVIEGYKTQLIARENNVLHKDVVCTDLQQWLHNAEAKNTALKGTQGQLEERMRKKEQELADARKALSGANQTLHAMRNSLSWKITAPLRGAKRVVEAGKTFMRMACNWKCYQRLFAVIRNHGLRKICQKIIMVLRTQGIAGVIYYMNRKVVYALPDYQQWVASYDSICDHDRRLIRSHIEQLPYKPLISVIMPVYNVEVEWLREAIESVRAQLYTRWELCIADDCSPSPHIAKLLKEYSKKDKRIKVEFRTENGHVSECSNSAVALASGEFIALFGHDDRISEHALYYVAYELNKHPEADLIYSDEDKLDENGQRFDPYFKSDWNPDLFYCQNMFSQLGVYRRSIITKIGGFRKGYEGGHDYDLCLRALKQTTPDKVRHIPHILYHRRAVESSVVPGAGYEMQPARRAIQDYFADTHPDVTIQDAPGSTGYHRLYWPVPDPAPKITLIVPTRNAFRLLSTCINSILEITDYPNYDILIMNNQSDDPETLAYFAHITTTRPNVRVMDYDAPFNFSSINNVAVDSIDSPLVGFINNDIEAIHADWLHEMVSHALRPEIGAVGAKLYYPNNTVQHAGIITGVGIPVNAVAGHFFHGVKREELGYFCRAQLTQSLSGVTAACLIMRKEVFLKVGGFEEEHLTVAFNDVDLCLKIREKGYRIIWTPYAELYHHESATRGYEDTPEKFERFRKEVAYMRYRWKDVLDNDPYYNPNLDLLRSDFSLAFPPRAMKPWLR